MIRYDGPKPFLLVLKLTLGAQANFFKAFPLGFFPSSLSFLLSLCCVFTTVFISLTVV